MGTALEEIQFFRQPGDQLKNNRELLRPGNALSLRFVLLFSGCHLLG
jgi:hypothetical protein